MSIRDYINLSYLAIKDVGDYVHIYHDSFIHNVKNNVLGRYDDHSIGKIVKKEGPCAHVQFGSENNIGIYDMASLANVVITLKNTAVTKTGSLGNPIAKILGQIQEWSNFGKGDTVLVKGPTTTSSYPVSDLEFRPMARFDIPSTRGGSRRVTLRKKKLPSSYTRLIKRV
jgi:hypothetical protein